MPLEILQLAGFNYLKHTTPGQKQKSRLETISENDKMFYFWFSFANFALFNVLRLIYLISNLKNLNVSIYAVVVITNAFSVLCKCTQFSITSQRFWKCSTHWANRLTTNWIILLRWKSLKLSNFTEYLICFSFVTHMIVPLVGFLLEERRYLPLFF